MFFSAGLLYWRKTESSLVRLVEEPAVDLAVGGVEGSMFHEQVHLGHHQCGAGFEKGQEVVKLEKPGSRDHLQDGLEVHRQDESCRTPSS